MARITGGIKTSLAYVHQFVAEVAEALVSFGVFLCRSSVLQSPRFPNLQPELQPVLPVLTAPDSAPKPLH